MRKSAVGKNCFAEVPAMACNTEFDGKFAVEKLDRNDDFIKSRIFSIRGIQVMLSVDLAPLYGVEVKYLHRQVRRNENRFPFDFALHLSPEEANALRCQNVTSKRGGDRYGVMAFTEQGVAMLSSVLKSDRAAWMAVRRSDFVAGADAQERVPPVGMSSRGYTPFNAACVHPCVL